jgi:hypothetical protein
MRGGYRLRLTVNLANLSTLTGILVGLAGRARLTPAGDGLLIASGYRLPVPPAPAFCVGNVIVTRLGRGELEPGSPLFTHEARHATQFACCAGVVMIPLYLLAAGLSWVLTGNFGSRNVFERRAGLADGGYTDLPLRPAVRRVLALAGPRGAGRERGGEGELAGSRLEAGGAAQD